MTPNTADFRIPPLFRQSRNWRYCGGATVLLYQLIYITWSDQHLNITQAHCQHSLQSVLTFSVFLVCYMPIWCLLCITYGTKLGLIAEDIFVGITEVCYINVSLTIAMYNMYKRWDWERHIPLLSLSTLYHNSHSLLTHLTSPGRRTSSTSPPFSNHDDPP